MFISLTVDYLCYLLIHFFSLTIGSFSLYASHTLLSRQHLCKHLYSTVHVYLYKSICFIMMDLNSFVLILWPPYFHLLYIEVLTSESGLSFPIDVGENYKDSP